MGKISLRKVFLTIEEFMLNNGYPKRSAESLRERWRKALCNLEKEDIYKIKEFVKENGEESEKVKTYHTILDKKGEKGKMITGFKLIQIGDYEEKALEELETEVGQEQENEI